MTASTLDPFAHLRDTRFWAASLIVLTSIVGLHAIGVLPPAALFPVSFLGSASCVLLSRWRMRHERERGIDRCVECGAKRQLSYPAPVHCSSCGLTDPYGEERQ